jgi:uncharacterized protein (TIGR03435 family)
MRMRNVASPVVLGLVLAAVGAAPSAQTPGPRFEVASIKPNPSRVGIRGHRFPGDRFEAGNVPVRDLILIAFGERGRSLQDVQMSGGPAWLDTDRFDVTATVGADADKSVGQKQLMLRQLLIDRFKLVTHTEKRELPIYNLVLAKPDGELGRQLRRSPEQCGEGDAGAIPDRLAPGDVRGCFAYVVPPGTLTVRGQTMGAIAYALTATVGRIVVDGTGLRGAFDADAVFNPEGLPGWQPPPAGSPNRDAPAFFGALQEELGLRLESGRGPVDVLVIDHIERPSGN